MYKKKHLVDDRQHAHLPSAESFTPKIGPVPPKQMYKKNHLVDNRQHAHLPSAEVFFYPQNRPCTP
jgi:hypothetical protein